MTWFLFLQEHAENESEIDTHRLQPYHPECTQSHLKLTHSNVYSGMILISTTDFYFPQMTLKAVVSNGLLPQFKPGNSMQWPELHHRTTHGFYETHPLVANQGRLLAWNFFLSAWQLPAPPVFQLLLSFFQIGWQKAGFGLDVLHSMAGCVCVGNLEQE